MEVTFSFDFIPDDDFGWCFGSHLRFFLVRDSVLAAPSSLVWQSLNSGKCGGVSLVGLVVV